MGHKTQKIVKHVEDKAPLKGTERDVELALKIIFRINHRRSQEHVLIAMSKPLPVNHTEM